MNEQTKVFDLSDQKFDEKTIRESFKEKAKFHDIICIYSKAVIWPEMEVLPWENSSYVISLKHTKHHLDAVNFFHPFVKMMYEKYRKVVLEVGPNDLGLQKIHGKYEFKCIKVTIEYDRLYGKVGGFILSSCETVYFAENTKHSVLVDEDFRQRAMSEKCGNTAEYLNILHERSLLPHKSVLLRTNVSLSSFFESFITTSHVIRRFGDSTAQYLSTAASVNGKAYYTKSRDEQLIIIHGPSIKVFDCIKFLKMYAGEPFEILAETELEYEFKRSDTIHHDYVLQKSIGKETRSKYQHDSIVDICIALSFMNAPYSILDIIDSIPSLAWANRIRKVGLIESTFASIRKVWNAREELKSRKI